MDQSVNGLSPSRQLFARQTVHVTFLADPVGLGKVLYAFWSFPVGTAYAMYFSVRQH